MREIVALIATIGALLLLEPNNLVAAQEANTVSVNETDLGDYGASFTVSSTVAKTTFVRPYVVSSENVNGHVVPMIQLAPNERDVNIGQYIQADRSEDWSIEV